MSEESSAAVHEKKGITVRDVPSAQFIQAFAEHLKKSGKIELPKYHDYAKTSVAKELPPQNPDWFYIRVAAVARRVYLRPGSGVGGLSRGFGSVNRKGVRPAFYEPANTGIIRHALQALERNNFIGKRKNKKGRYITSEGQRELDTVAGQIQVRRGILSSLF